MPARSLAINFDFAVLFPQYEESILSLPYPASKFVSKGFSFRFRKASGLSAALLINVRIVLTLRWPLLMLMIVRPQWSIAPVLICAHIHSGSSCTLPLADALTLLFLRISQRNPGPHCQPFYFFADFAAGMAGSLNPSDNEHGHKAIASSASVAKLACSLVSPQPGPLTGTYPDIYFAPLRP